jgi:predicted RNA binding protein YcfA (HicA-like mRNA interferase family)
MALGALLCCSGQRPEWADAVKVGVVIKRLEAAGWFLVATRGSHRQFKHPIRPGRVTVAGKPSDELAPGTLRSIEKQSGVPLR